MSTPVEEKSQALTEVRQGVKQFCDTENPMTIPDLARRLRPDRSSQAWLYKYIKYLDARGEVVLKRHILPGKRGFIFKVTLPKIHTKTSQLPLPPGHKSKTIQDFALDVAILKKAEGVWKDPGTEGIYFREIEILLKHIGGDMEVNTINEDIVKHLKASLEDSGNYLPNSIRSKIDRLREIMVEAVRQKYIKRDPLPSNTQLWGGKAAYHKAMEQRRHPLKFDPKPIGKAKILGEKQVHEVGYIRRIFRAVKRGGQAFWRKVW